MATGHFGLIFHWGIYAVPAYDDIESASRRKIQNGSEWYKKRLYETGTFRPVSGYKETQDYHAKKFGSSFLYDDFRHYFKPTIDFTSWIGLAKQISATYVILTAKHHDGYCLWPTKSGAFCSERNLLGDFINAARAAGLSVGIYYSWSEFPTPGGHSGSMTKDYMKKVIIQMNELREYKPDIWWFDGHWEIKADHTHKTIEMIIAQLKIDNPYVWINDRLGEKLSTGDLGMSNFRVYEDRAIMTANPGVPWEHINTIGLSWGFNSTESEADTKSGLDLFNIYSSVSRLGGRTLFNLGPDAYGNFNSRECQSLIDFAKLRAASLISPTVAVSTIDETVVVTPINPQ